MERPDIMQNRASPDRPIPAAEPVRVSPDRLDAFTRRGHLAWLGGRIHDIGPDWVEMANDCGAELAGDDGMMSSAAVFGMIDSACGMALWVRRGITGHQVTIDLRVDFIRPVPVDRTLIVRTWCTAISGRIAYLSASGYHDDPADPVCTAAASFMTFDRNPA